MSVEGLVYTLTAAAKGTLQWRRRWARARVRVCGMGGSDDAGRDRGGHCWGSRLQWLRWGEGRKGEVKVNGPSPSPFYKACRQPKSLWAISL